MIVLSNVSYYVFFFFFTEASVGFTIESSVFFVSEQFSLSSRHMGFKFSLAQFFTIFSAQYFQVLLETTGSIRLWVRRWCPREKEAKSSVYFSFSSKQSIFRDVSFSLSHSHRFVSGRS